MSCKLDLCCIYCPLFVREELVNEMDFVKLTFSFLISLRFAGEPEGANIQSKVYPVQHKGTENVVAHDRPGPLRKHIKRLKRHKFHHLKRCLNEECNYFILLNKDSGMRKDDNQRVNSKSSLPVNLTGGTHHQFGFKERKVKRSFHKSGTIQPTNIDTGRINVENYFSQEVQTTMPKYRKQNRPRWRDRSTLEHLRKLQESHGKDLSSVNSFLKFEPSEMFNSHPRVIKKRDTDVIKSSTDKVKDEDNETTTSEKVEITKPGTTVCPTMVSDSRKKGNESRMPYDWDRDSYMALGSLTFLLLVLTCAVMYTGLWKKRNTMLYPDFVDLENSSTRRKTDIKELLKIKLGKIPIRRYKRRAKMKNHRNHHRKYSELPLVEDMEGESGSGPEFEMSSDEEEIYSNGRRNVKASSYY